MDMSITNQPFQKSAAEIIQAILLDAIKTKASDIHFEPDMFRLRVRYRIDGVMHDILEIPLEFQDSLVRQLKEKAGLEVAFTKIPQEGRFTFTVNGREYQFILSSLVAIYGERIVMHLIMQPLLEVSLQELGFSPETENLLYGLSEKPAGLLLITGSLGDGRSTTALNLLNRLSAKGKRCAACEDAHSYEVKGITHYRDELRNDILEEKEHLEDEEVVLFDEVMGFTAMNLAFTHALSGKLVIAVTRSRNAHTVLKDLITMGMTGEAVSSVLLGVLAQKLVKVICPHCRKSYNPHPWELRVFEARREFPAGFFQRGTGCEKCHLTGYSGRTPLEQLIVMDGELKNLVFKGDVAAMTGKEPGLLPSGRDLCLRGITTMQEVIRALEW